MGKFEDITGKRYGRILILSRAGNGGSIKKPTVRWNCKCDCGAEKVIEGHSLKNGRTKSCGCLNNEKRNNNLVHKTHDGSQTRIYKIYAHMKARCLNKKNPKYKVYGGRGIRICKEWMNDFAAFRAWAMESGYSDTLTIERINNDGNYEPSNCRWATMYEQSQNKQNTVLVNFEGVVESLQYWGEIRNQAKEYISKIAYL